MVRYLKKYISSRVVELCTPCDIVHDHVILKLYIFLCI